ncbi:hypothetical protein BH11ARM1_BH11ARM1_03850 [soil metagenome]
MVLLSLAFAASGPVVLHSRITNASIFKSGLVYLTREVTVPAGKGDYCLDEVPTAIDGTFWYDSPDGLVLRDIRTHLDLTEKKESSPAKTVNDYLIANVGKKITVGIRVDKEIQYISGILNSLEPVSYNASANVTLKMSNGFLRTLSSSEIVALNVNGLSDKVAKSVSGSNLLMMFSTEIATPKRLRFVTIERGAAWTGSYLVTLDKQQKATIEGKAQVAVGGLKLETTKVTAIAGAANLPATTRYDLASGVGPLYAYLSTNQYQFTQYLKKTNDPFAMLPTLVQQRQQWAGQGVGGFGGGMGGGGGLYRGGPAEDSPGISEGLISLASTPEANRVESLYAYPLGDLSLEPGDRLTRRLFKQDTNYESLFKWNADNANVKVDNVLRLTNDSKVPWTGGLTMVVKNEIPLAQVDMPFTSVGQHADLSLGLASDIIVSRNDRVVRTEETSLEYYPHLILRKSVEEVSLQLQNTRDEAANVEITVGMTGEVTIDGGATVVQDRSLNDQFNLGHRGTWLITLQPGEKKQLTITSAKVFSAGNR